MILTKETTEEFSAATSSEADSQLNITSRLTEVDFSEMKQALDFLPERMK